MTPRAPACATDESVSLKGRSPVVEKNLLSDQSGATMVMGVFMAMVVVGMIYYVWGIGGTIIHRERLQDAADTGLFSAAVIHARAMNLIVLLNVIMQVLAILGTAMRVIQDCLTAAAIAAGLTALGCGPWCAFCCEAIPYIPIYTEEAISAADDASDMEDDVVFPAVEGIGAAQGVIQTGAPLIAFAMVTSEWAGHYAPATSGGAVTFYSSSLLDGLQMEDDDSNWACRNKVALWAGIAGAAGAAIEGSQSVWLYAGIATATVPSAILRSDTYCDTDEDHNFQRVPEDSRLGTEDYQLRGGVVWSNAPPHEWTQRGVQIASWGNEGNTSPNIAGISLDFARTAHRIALAQSEYYYETSGDDTDHEEWAWHPYWRARMRRFRIGSDSQGGSILNSLLGVVQDVIVH